MADAKITQVVIEVQRTGDPAAKMTQAVVEVLRDNITAQTVIVVIG